MADQSDVENALVSLAATALYPNGSAGTSVSGNECTIYRGWPNSTALNADLAAGRINVTVFPSGEPGHNTTRYLPRWITSPSSSALVATVTTDSVTFSGTASVGELAGILADTAAFVYPVQGSDTPATVAANLASLIQPSRIANLSGSSVTIPGVFRLVARVVAGAQGSFEARRQRQCFRITCWCPDPVSRDVCGSAIDQSLASLTYLTLADATFGRLWYRGTLVFDQSQDALLYRRDLLYDVEYATVVTALQPAMLFGSLTLNGTQDFS